MIERTTKRALAASLALVLAAASASSLAGPAEDEARSRQLFKQGSDLANSGQFAQACPLFQQAHDLHSTGGTALRTADCYEKVGKYPEALALYQYIVDHKDTDKQPERVALAEGRVAALKKQLAAEPTATAVATAAPTAPTATATAAPTVSVIARSAPTVSVNATAAPVETAKPPSKALTYTSFAVGGGSALISALNLVVSISITDKIKGQCDPKPALCPLETEHKNAVGLLVLSELGFGVAAAGVVTGVVLLVSHSSPKAQQTVQKALGPRGVTFHF